MPISAVIFDLDGTLVNTVHLWARAYVDSLSDIGVDMSEEEFIENLYSKASHLHATLAGIGKLEAVDAFRTNRDSRYISALQETAIWLPGVENVLKALQDKTRLSIATGSHRSYVEALDTKLGLSKYVEMIITCDDIPAYRSKPEPDLLLLTAERMGLAPQECIYIGDQMFDVAAAKAANMPCWIIPNSSTPNEATMKADRVLQSFEELLTLE
jgi:HAD superfamily hydrolase (TIGR01509 family)